MMADVRKGLIIVNTGPGKGKTTAAMGTGLRAVGAGLKVLMLQFLKGSWHYGELDAVKAFGDQFVMRQMGRGFVKVGGAETDPEDVKMVEECWKEAEDGACHLDREECASGDRGAGGYGDGDARGEARVSEGDSGAKRD